MCQRYNLGPILRIYLFHQRVTKKVVVDHVSEVKSYHACVRACVRVCVSALVRACVRVCVCLYRPPLHTRRDLGIIRTSSQGVPRGFNPSSTLGLGGFTGQHFKKSGKFHELPRKSIHCFYSSHPYPTGGGGGVFGVTI